MEWNKNWFDSFSVCVSYVFNGRLLFHWNFVLVLVPMGANSIFLGVWCHKKEYTYSIRKQSDIGKLKKGLRTLHTIYLLLCRDPKLYRTKYSTVL